MSEQKNLAVGDMSEHVASAGAAACDPVVGVIVKDESVGESAAASRESRPRRAGPSARQECGDLRQRPQELDAPVSWKACWAQFATLASGVKGVKGLVGGLRGKKGPKGLAGGLTPRRVRVKSPLWEDKKPRSLRLEMELPGRGGAVGVSVGRLTSRGRPPSARMTKWTHPYPPLPRFRGGLTSILSYSCSV
ncbi:hypothetical protein GWK47_040960 [Chionoecetes opilio]|uniref:Uncharacterized protein n=1 Tax=Chionoecetes opilio TaxID=41210 RepID=A0A8J5CX35_CHIOP|nr:hypothetical protein GWK47_040960 [Chionoecetes opilio]